jgi:pimeloyl-ACP methyl ester carboxylesterase
MSILAINGFDIEYRLIESPTQSDLTLVVLHEGLGSTAMWRDFPERLGQAVGAKVLVYSRMGYGLSTPLSADRDVDYMHEEARRSLPAVLDRLNIRNPVLFGHSDGASIALIHAAEPESTARAVIALAPHVKVEDVSVASIERIKAAFETTDLRERLARYHANVESAFWGWNRIWLNPAFRSWNIEYLLPAIRCPVLAIQGWQDEYGTMEQIESVARLVRRSQTLALADCRHSPHRDQAKAVIQATSKFVEQLGKPSPSHDAEEGTPTAC